MVEVQSKLSNLHLRAWPLKIIDKIKNLYQELLYTYCYIHHTIYLLSVKLSKELQIDINFVKKLLFLIKWNFIQSFFINKFN